MIFTFPANVRQWLGAFVTSLVMSVVHGAIFWNVRGTVPGFQAEQEDINDRLALHYVIGTVAVWPTLMLMISDVWRERESVARDVRDRLYGRFVFFLSKVVNLLCSFLARFALFIHRARACLSSQS